MRGAVRPLSLLARAVILPRRRGRRVQPLSSSTFVALLLGAFFASFAATFGGRRRDAVVYLETIR